MKYVYRRFTFIRGLFSLTVSFHYQTLFVTYKLTKGLVVVDLFTVYRQESLCSNHTRLYSSIEKEREIEGEGEKENFIVFLKNVCCFL